MSWGMSHCHSDHQTQGAHSSQLSLQSLTRWLQMAALQTLQCPRPSDCRLRQSSGLLQPCRHRGPIGTRAWSETDQWEAGRCKGWHPSSLSAPSAADTDSGNLQHCSAALGCRVLSPDWGSITDHLQPPALAWDRSMSSAISLATDLGPLIGHSVSLRSQATCVHKDQHPTFLQWHQPVDPNLWGQTHKFVPSGFCHLEAKLSKGERN